MGSASRRGSSEWTRIYAAKRRSARDAADLVRPDDTLALPIATGQPTAFLHALGERDDYTALTVFTGLLLEAFAVFQRPGVRLISGFYGPVERQLKASGARVEYLPADFLAWERYAERVRPRVLASAVAPMDEHGYLNFSLHAGATFRAFLEAARDPERLAIAEVNPNLPSVPGLGRYGGHRIHVTEVDCVVESDRPVLTLPEQPPSAADEAIAARIEAEIEDGSTLQIGIGGVPNAVAQLLAKGEKGDFGIHTEMMVDGIMHLHRAGKVTNHKGIFDGFSVCTFAAGSADLYRWMHRNPEVRMLPVGLVNDPANIRRNRRMVSINGALAVDLAGQVVADAIGPRQYSGVGGHELFVMGASTATEGKSFVCLHSTAVVGGERVSRIVPALLPGTPVTTPRHHVQFVVTEHGAVELSLLSDAERARALVQIADPEFRGELAAHLANRQR